MQQPIKAIFSIIAGLLLAGTTALAQQTVPKGTKKVIEYEQDYDKGKPDGNPVIKSESYYNAQGQLTSEVTYKEGKKDQTTLYEYDQDNHKIKETEKNANDKVTKTVTYKYVNGRKTERTVKNAEGITKSTRSYRYE